MKNQALIQEAISQLSHKFAPRIPDIKQVCDIYTIRHGLVLTGVIGN